MPDDMRRRLWEYTAGRPIRLSLLIDLALNGQDIAELFPPLSGETPQIEKEQIDAHLMRESWGCLRRTGSYFTTWHWPARGLTLTCCTI